MIEERIAERMREAVSDEPPLGFDPDELVTEAAQRGRRRRAVALTAGGVTLVVAAVFASIGTPGAGQMPVGASPPAVESFLGSDTVTENLERVIPTVLADRMPGLVFDEPRAGLVVLRGRRGVVGTYRLAGTPNVEVTVHIDHGEDELDLAGDPAIGRRDDLVSDTPQPDGSHLRVYRFAEGASALGVTVVHLRADGVVVLVDCTATLEPGQNGLPVSQDLLTAVATDVRLRF
ncbi:hypothetical protein [Actinophytocola xanthii]|uniref:Uncharacterized protein n=1 Tax=Actinophytocola xanthii TaxID=1912961 RepID=A0A1Q8CQR7_9PSEU|nr:hypothetical protein [Actinophytocola xanthii]OLF16704.1 hypothetical protein BU204_15345 [Actinophytocola xanthii]